MASIADVGAMVGLDVTRPEQGALESKVSVMAEQVISAWRREGPDETSGLGPSILAMEFLLHGWDLAQASGQTMVAADPLVDYVRELAEDIVHGGRGATFADEVPPALRADALGRLAAYAGRTPLA